MDQRGEIDGSEWGAFLSAGTFTAQDLWSWPWGSPQEAPKVLEKLRTHRWASTALRWAGTCPFLPMTVSALQSPHGELGWNQPLCRRAPGCRQLPILGVHLTVLSHSKSLTCPGLKGCLNGKEEWQEVWHKFNSKFNFPSHSAGRNNLYKLQGGIVERIIWKQL